MGTWVPVPAWAQKDKRTFPAPKDGVANQVENRFDKCEEYAQDAVDNANEFIGNLENLLEDFDPPDSDIGTISNPWVGGLSYDDRPALGDVTLKEIPESDILLPDCVDIPDFDTAEFPNFNITAPSVSAVKPQHSTITVPGDSPAMGIIEYPATPDPEIPTPPTLRDISFPSAPSIAIPVFDTVAPSSTMDLPDNFSYNEAVYSSDIWADLLSKVLNDIRNGGTGLGALIEEELYDRALRRQETENERLYQEVENYFEARGFSLPPGAMAGRLAEAAREISRNNTTVNADIAVNQAELAQKNTQFMVEKGVELEGMLREFFNQQAVRSFEAAKAIAQIGIEILNAHINRFNAKVQAYQVEGAVFESRVKAALTQAEIYKTQIDACEVMSNVQKNLTMIYSEKVKAIDTIIKLYATEMEAARIKAEVEKIKVDVFMAQTQVYTAKIEADKLKFEAYSVELDGEKTKAMIYAEQVRAYLGQVDAVKSESDVRLQALDLILKSNQDKTNQYKAQLAGYETEVNATSSSNTAIVDGFKTEVMAYSAEAEAEGIHLAAKIKEMDLSISAARFRLDKAVAEVQAAITGFKAVKDLQVQGVSGIMDVGAQLAASAMNAINANASLGLNQSQSEGETWHHGDSISESHPYEEVAGSSE
jgi:hypothetical protein